MAILDGTYAKVEFAYDTEPSANRMPGSVWGTIISVRLRTQCDMIDVTPLDSRSKRFRRQHLRSQVHLIAYIDQNVPPGWFNEDIQQGDDKHRPDMLMTLYPDEADTDKYMRCNVWVERIEKQMAVDTPNRIEAVLWSSSELIEQWS